MYIDFEPGDYVVNPANKGGNWTNQSIIDNKVTVNFENLEKGVSIEIVTLES